MHCDPSLESLAHDVYVGCFASGARDPNTTPRCRTLPKLVSILTEWRHPARAPDCHFFEHIQISLGPRTSVLLRLPPSRSMPARLAEGHVRHEHAGRRGIPVEIVADEGLHDLHRIGRRHYRLRTAQLEWGLAGGSNGAWNNNRKDRVALAPLHGSLSNVAPNRAPDCLQRLPSCSIV
jgi:hypothetical protein